MRTYSGPVGAALAARRHVSARALIRVTAKDRTTGAAEAIGFWTGADHRTFTIGGSSLLYYGAGAALSIPDIVAESGLTVREHQFGLSGVAPEVAQAFRVYDARLAPFELHRALFDGETGALLSEPHMVLRGTVDGVTFDDGEGASEVMVTVAGATRDLTLTLPLKRSDESYRRRSGDRIMRYSDIGGAAPVYWGEKGRQSAGSETPTQSVNDFLDRYR